MGGFARNILIVVPVASEPGLDGLFFEPEVLPDLEVRQSVAAAAPGTLIDPGRRDLEQVSEIFDGQQFFVHGLLLGSPRHRAASVNECPANSRNGNP
jgi:hypothetical protein